MITVSELEKRWASERGSKSPYLQQTSTPSSIVQYITDSWNALKNYSALYFGKENLSSHEELGDFVQELDLTLPNDDIDPTIEPMKILLEIYKGSKDPKIKVYKVCLETRLCLQESSLIGKEIMTQMNFLRDKLREVYEERRTTSVKRNCV